ncbi:hypothetical protein N7G274_009186 [Stereocaulon virgatum]|uniref:Spindle pole body component n=1 Tax=Stereocaulon virgatum TaxID=373712 RepID=A0ABR4A0V4_9LECA
MDDYSEDGNVFAIPGLWKTSSLADLSQHSIKPIAFQLEPLGIPLSLDLCAVNSACSQEHIAKLSNAQEPGFGIPKSLDLHLPDLSTFQYGPLEDLGGLDSSSISSATESFEPPKVLEEDIWAFSRSNEKGQSFAKFKSWETFYDKEFTEPQTVYVSEGGPRVFDAALSMGFESTAEDDLSRGPGRVIQSGPIIASLLQLGLGRDSLLFRYDQEKESFQPYIEDGRMSGYSLEAFKSLSDTFIGYGNQTRRLRSFIEETQVSGRSSPALVALVGSFSAILATVQAEIGSVPNSPRSLLQLQSLFEKPGLVLAWLSDIVPKVNGVNTDEELLSRLFQVAESSEHTAAWLRPMVFQVLTSASRPWLESAGSWLGLNTRTGFRSQGQPPSFVKVSEGIQKPEAGRGVKEYVYEFHPLSMPSFIAEEDGRIMFETGQSLRMLDAHRPEHPLLRPPLSSSIEKPSLEWRFSWAQVEKIQERAKKYELNLQKAIKDFDLFGQIVPLEHEHCGNSEQTGIETAGLSEEMAKAYIGASIVAFERPLPALTAGFSDETSNLSTFDGCGISDMPEEEIFAPPTSLLPVLSFNPLILAQARLINQACLRLLFKEYNLRSHFAILNRYSLFGDGVFASRLSHALFDPELPTAERRRGHSRAGTSGLKLGSRDTWPPASSELRLALMGILTDSYWDTRLRETASLFREELPGGLSFAIRDMSEDELQRCMDPNSIEALDFLRLQFEPPSPLDAIITPSSLVKYDAVFKLLLRAVRMLFVVSHLFQDAKDRARYSDFEAQRFRIESHHFVSAICSYFFDGVQANWSILERKLNDTEKELEQGGTESISKLRDFHERVLDRMMFTLILRKRQAQVMKLVEDIFSLILHFARYARSKASGLISDADQRTNVAQIYEKFKKKVRVFISVCRGLSERRGQGGTTSQHNSHDLSRDEEMSEDGSNTIGQLLLKFETSCFYAR